MGLHLEAKEVFFFTEFIPILDEKINCQFHHYNLYHYITFGVFTSWNEIYTRKYRNESTCKILIFKIIQYQKFGFFTTKQGTCNLKDDIPIQKLYKT